MSTLGTAPDTNDTVTVRPGMAFIKEGQLRLINQKWIVATDISLDIYLAQLDALRTELMFIKAKLTQKFSRNS